MHWHSSTTAVVPRLAVAAVAAAACRMRSSARWRRSPATGRAWLRRAAPTPACTRVAGRAFRHATSRGRIGVGARRQRASAGDGRRAVGAAGRRRLSRALQRDRRATTRYVLLNRPVRPGAARRPRRLVPSPARRRGDARGRPRSSSARTISRRSAPPSARRSRRSRRCASSTIARRGAARALRLRANAFLHHMVRNIVGALVDVGSGQAAARLDRRAAARRATARARRRRSPPTGCTSRGADYDARWGLPPTLRDPCAHGAAIARADGDPDLSARASRSAASRASPTASRRRDAGADAIGLVFWPRHAALRDARARARDRRARCRRS